ncbi:MULTISPECIES: hypothetical protein [unclassified Bradyrhizobium]|uniref:hypothetical protein n=1 Tax=unclassified Bradyrhizobium TaxID=2631580 RepID=UPI001FF8FEAF|nr:MULTISPECIES: hypothetical protein [unclassified Bradyrhizobium]
MRIVSHSESHIVELDDGSRWQVFPGDVDITLGWTPETDLRLTRIDGDVSDQVLVSNDDDGRVRVLPEGALWPKDHVKAKLGSTRRSRRATK